MKRIFPQLRKMCEERGITWGEVDLRWGITDEQKAEGKVLPICLEEIKRCRPYFIGILGERYGWIPEAIPQDIIEQEPWIAEHLSHSVTELEILHGALNNPEMANHSFFYFRDPGYVNTVPKKDRHEFISEDANFAKKLKDLKYRIRKSSLPVREDYLNPKTLGDLVLQDLTMVINNLYSSDEKIDPLDRESMDQEAFAQSRVQVYVGREEYYNRLNEHVESKEKPLVILGESGLGKSALLANWALRYRESHPDILILMHFIGVSSYSSDWATMVRRIMGELKRHFKISQAIPDKLDDLRLSFANFLHIASAKGKVVIILDALNQLEDREVAQELIWLPPFIPENIRLILSTLPGKSLDELTKRDWPRLMIHPITEEEKRALISAYLKQYTKSLSKPRIDRITNSAQTSNPLFLKVLLEELRLFGKHEGLDERIDYYLKAQDPYHLYNKVIARWEEDFGEGINLVKNSLSFIWASHRGLTETELLEILGTDGKPFPRAAWSPLFLAIREFLVNRLGFFTFAHNFLRDAVRDTYIPTEEHQHHAHLRLADYFESHELSPRKIDELPWQLMRGQAWSSLFNLFSDLQFLSAAWESSKFETLSYWEKIENSSTLRKVDAYRNVLKKPSQISNINHLETIANLFFDTGNLDESFKLQSYLVDIYKNNDIKISLQTWLRNLANTFRIRGNPDKALTLLLEQESLCIELGCMEGLENSFLDQALILRSYGDLDKAMTLLKKMEKLSEELNDNKARSYSMVNQAIILRDKGDIDGAMTLFKKQERLCQEIGDIYCLQASLGEQGITLMSIGQLDTATKLYKEQEKICRDLGNKYWLSICLGNQASLLSNQGFWHEAMELHKEEERLCREIGDKEGLQASLGNQAIILRHLDDLIEAMKLHKEQELICHEIGHKYWLAISLREQGNILYLQGELDQAMILYTQQQKLCQELGNKLELANCIGNQANILRDQGNLNEAMLLYKQQENICRKLNLKIELSDSLNNQAGNLFFQGQLDEAIILSENAIKLCREVQNPWKLSNYLGTQGVVLLKQGYLDRAMAVFKEKEGICRKIGYKKGLKASLSFQTYVLIKQGNKDESTYIVEEFEQLCRDTFRQ